MRLLAAWRQADPTADRDRAACQYLAGSARYQRGPIDRVADVLGPLPHYVLGQFRALASWWLDVQASAPEWLRDPVAFLELAWQLVSRGQPLSAQAAQRCGQVLFEQLAVNQAHAFRDLYLVQPEAIRQWYETLSPHYQPASLAAWNRWLSWFAAELAVLDPPAALRALEWLARQPGPTIASLPNDGQAMRQTLRPLVFELLSQPEYREAAHRAWLTLGAVWTTEVHLALEHCLTWQPPATALAGDYLNLLLERNLLAANPEACELVPRWVQALASAFPAQAAELVDRLAQMARPAQHSLVADALRCLLDAAPRSAQALAHVARLASQIHHPELEAEACDRSLALLASDDTTTRAARHQIHVTLLRLHAPGGALADLDKHTAHTLQAARTTADSATALSFYHSFLMTWDWPRLQEELAWLAANGPANDIAPTLLTAWLRADSEGRGPIICQYLAESGLHEQWSDQWAVRLFRHIPLRSLEQFPALAGWWLNAQAETPKDLVDAVAFVKLGMSLALRGQPLSAQVFGMRGKILFEQNYPASAATLPAAYLANPESPGRWLAMLQPHYRPSSLVALFRWLDWFPIALQVEFPHAAVQLLEWAADLLGRPAAQLTDNHSRLRTSLRVLVIKLLAPSDTRRAAHEAWLRICRIWPDEILDYIRYCLDREPSAPDMADDGLELLLQQRDCTASIRGLAAAIQTPHLASRSARIDRAIELIRLLDTLTAQSDIAVSPKLESAHFQAILAVFEPARDVQRADMAAVLIAHLRQSAGPGWLTPVSFQVQVLGYAGRRAEAAELASGYADLTIGPRREPAPVFLRQLVGPTRAAPANERDYQRLIEDGTRDWACRAPARPRRL